MLNITSMITRTFRFIASGATAWSATANDLMDLYFFATGTTTGYRLSGATRIKKIEIWSPPYSAASSNYQTNTIAFQWATTQSGIIGAPSRVLTDTALGSNDVGHVVSRPPIGSLAGSWISAAATMTDTLFSLNCATSTVVDLTVSMNIPEGGVSTDNAQPLVRALAAATAGVIYVSSYPVGAVTLVPVFMATL